MTMRPKHMIGLAAMLYAGLGISPAPALETIDLAGTWHAFIEYRVERDNAEPVLDYADGHLVILGDGTFQTCADSDAMVESSWLVLHRQTTTLDPTGCQANVAGTPGFWTSSGYVTAGTANKFSGELRIENGSGLAVDYQIIRGTVAPGAGQAEMVIDGTLSANGARAHGLIRLARRWPAGPDVVPVATPLVYVWGQSQVAWQDTGLDRYQLTLADGSVELWTSDQAFCNGHQCSAQWSGRPEPRRVCNVSLTGLAYGCRVRP